MFERDASQAKEQVGKRYVVFGAFAMAGLACGVMIGGVLGIVVGLGIAVIGSTVTDIMHMGHIGSNIAQNGIRNSHGTPVEPTADLPLKTNFRDNEITRRQTSAEQQRGA